MSEELSNKLDTQFILLILKAFKAEIQSAKESKAKQKVKCLPLRVRGGKIRVILNVLIFPTITGI